MLIDDLLADADFDAPTYSLAHSYVDQRPGGADEPHPQGSYGQALPLPDTRSAKGALAAFLDAYNFAKRLKTLRGLTPYEAICRAWTDDPERFSRQDAAKAEAGRPVRHLL